VKVTLSEKLPPPLNWENLVSLIGQANADLARYDGFLHGIINPEIMLSPLTLQEAVLSSRIEGTQASLSEVLQHEAGERFEENKERDIQEIINYREALAFAEQQLNKRPLSLNLIKQMHAMLLDSVRGHNKARGEFRHIQNWIGPPGCTIEKATYVPPDPSQLMRYLDTWEKYMHVDEKDKLVQLAIIHAQFEIIHPFLDGNGRIGRILIPLFLFEKGLLSRPMFYLSGCLEAKRDQYYESLRKITSKGIWQKWIEFFLQSVIDQAKENTRKATRIQSLYDAMKQKVVEATRSQYALATLDTLFKRPIFKSADFTELSGTSKRTATTILSQLESKKIIIQMRKSVGRRPAVYGFTSLIDIVEDNRIT
jgi:Fic family protein